MTREASSVQGQPLLFPQSIIPSSHSDQTIVTDVSISRNTTFGPFPGTDAVEKNFNNWMEYVSCVTDFAESNLVVAIFKKQLYFHCHRVISAGTELLVWGGKKKLNFQNFSEWNKSENGDKEFTFLCQDCDFTTNSLVILVKHSNSSHLIRKFPRRNCQCPYCPYIATFKSNIRKHIINRHGINLYTKQQVVQNTVTMNSKTKQNINTQITSEENNQVQTYTSPSSLSMIENEDSEKYTYKCKFCKKPFKIFKQLHEHLLSFHKNKLKINAGNNKGKNSNSNNSLWRKKQQIKKQQK